MRGQRPPVSWSPPGASSEARRSKRPERPSRSRRTGLEATPRRAGDPRGRRSRHAPGHPDRRRGPRGGRGRAAPVAARHRRGRQRRIHPPVPVAPGAGAASRRRLLALPERGGGFDVAALDDAVPPRAPLDLVLREVPGVGPDDPVRVAIDGPEDHLREVVAWAVGARGAEGSPPGPFVASATAARDVWTGELPRTLPAETTKPAGVGRAWTAAGAAIDIEISV